MNEIMNIVHYEKKGKMLDTFEKYYIYKKAKSDNQLNDSPYRITPYSKQ